jgi:2-C-methyl-D-erythritol 2,4-cyclodiphosphate synthase
LGNDVHRLVPDRKLILGGETIPFHKGLLGHSDADVLVHAICDSLLGAAALGDIGMHFPDSNPAFKNIFSIELLKMTHRMVKQKGYTVLNLDATIFAEAPKLSPYYEKMKKNISDTLQIKPDMINIKSTTTEGLGFVGVGEGMVAMCISLIE